MTKSIEELKMQLKNVSKAEKAAFLPGFFQIGKAGYPAKDLFLGVSVPNCHKIAVSFKELTLHDVERLLKSPVHEERLTALFILVEQFEKGDEQVREGVYKFYLAHTLYINNWDLVDASAYKIVGTYLLFKPHDLLYTYAYSKNIWERRIAIVATMAFIRKNELQDTFKISEILLGDSHDLIHKAVGWLLREAGKKDPQLLINFLKKHYHDLARTSLRYAIEKFDPEVRKRYLKGEF